RGGSIFPGLRLMVKALHEHTALLPLVEVNEPCPYLPGLSTPQAMQAGVYYATAGGINTLIERLCARSGEGEAPAEPGSGGSAGASPSPLRAPRPTHIYLTGGDAWLLSH